MGALEPVFEQESRDGMRRMRILNTRQMAIGGGGAQTMVELFAVQLSLLECGDQECKKVITTPRVSSFQ